jgi:hypothetical protein
MALRIRGWLKRSKEEGRERGSSVTKYTKKK